MSVKKKYSRLYLTGGAVILVGAALTAAFWPRSMMVDMGTVTRGPMNVTIDEEGRSRVRNAYIISTPVAGRLLRVQVDPGDPVVLGDTVVAHMRPSNPVALDVRTRKQASTAVDGAKAASQVARADLKATVANRDLTQSELARTEALAAKGIMTHAELDRARQEARVALAHVETAKAAIAMRQAEVANAQAQLIGFNDHSLDTTIGPDSDDIPITAPVSGRILRIMQQSETTLPAGTPIMEIGDVGGDLEIIVELLSTDAVQVNIKDRVIIDDWGGQETLTGEVVRVDPFGVTKFSALGVEEQRVSAVIRLVSSAETYAGLGHGFRVEARIVIWEDNNILIVPASALFRERGEWAVFLVDNGSAVLRPITLGRNNGVEAQVLNGLDEDDQVVLYPSSELSEGMSIRQRTTD